MLVILLLLLVPVIGVFIVVILSHKENKFISYDNIIQIFAISLVCLLIALPLRAIINIISPSIGNILFTPVFIGLINCLCLTIRSLSSYSKFPSKYIIALNFILPIILAELVLGLDYLGLLRIVHFLILFSLAQLGWEVGLFKPLLESLGGFIHLASTGNRGGTGSSGGLGGSGGVGSSGIGNSGGLGGSGGMGSSINHILAQLNNMTIRIDNQIQGLAVEHQRFERLFFRATHHIAIGDQAGANQYVQLARDSRLKVRDSLKAIEDNLSDRSNFAAQAQGLLSHSRLSEYYTVEGKNFECMKIAYTLAYNRIWNI